MESIELTEVEKDAKLRFTRIIAEASAIPCDTGTGSNLQFKLPQWYDSAKFKRGQKYFKDNRFGMMGSNYYGLVTLLVIPKGLKLLNSTGRSSTRETARKRYIATTFHMLSWYEIDLSPGSKSWASLSCVREMHLHASNKANKSDIGFISQAEVALTTFGFLGYALLRPHLLGIKYDNDDDREAFVHFWAVVGAMLGVEDRYNICLGKLAVVETICQLCLRYIFFPLLQFEPPLFKTMVNAIIDGLGEFTPFFTYDSLMYLVRRVAGLPGYQHSVDLSKETICRRIYNTQELAAMNEILLSIVGFEYMDGAIFDERILLFDIKKKRDDCEIGENTSVSGNDTELPGINNAFVKYLDLKNDEKLVITAVEDEDKWNEYLNDSKVKTLGNKDLRYFELNCRLFENCYSRIGNFFNESILSFILYRMRKAHEK